MPKGLIGVDVDEVIYPYVEQFAKWHNERYGTSVGVADFIGYNFARAIGLSSDETLRRVEAFNQLDHSLVPPIDGAVEALTRLKQDNELVVITARGPELTAQTELWIARHFGDLFSATYYARYAHDIESIDTKAGILRTIHATVLIDDSVDTAQVVAQIGIPVMLFGDYPWSRGRTDLDSRIVRCPNWQEVMECL